VAHGARDLGPQRCVSTNLGDDCVRTVYLAVTPRYRCVLLGNPLSIVRTVVVALVGFVIGASYTLALCLPQFSPKASLWWLSAHRGFIRVHDRLASSASPRATSRLNTECDSAHGWVASSRCAHWWHVWFGFRLSFNRTFTCPTGCDRFGMPAMYVAAPDLHSPFSLEPVSSKACRCRLASQSP